MAVNKDNKKISPTTLLLPLQVSIQRQCSTMRPPAPSVTERYGAACAYYYYCTWPLCSTCCAIGAAPGVPVDREISCSDQRHPIVRPVALLRAGVVKRSFFPPIPASTKFRNLAYRAPNGISHVWWCTRARPHVALSSETFPRSPRSSALQLRGNLLFHLLQNGTSVRTAPLPHRCIHHTELGR